MGRHGLSPAPAILAGVELLADQLPGIVIGLITGLITGLISGLISGLVVATILESREQRRQVRKVTADIMLDWTPVPDSPATKILQGGHLIIANRSDWPIRDVIVAAPPPIPMLSAPYLGPGSERVEVISAEHLRGAELDDMPIEVQVEDVRGKLWRWVPRTGDLSPIPPPIPLHSHVIQWLAKRSPRLLHGLMRRLPKRARDWLWGYAPEG